jgi:uncharacterized membrane protein YoaK (UPF0700 family)
MTRYDLRLRLLAVALAGLAGFVDAVGFLELGGFFVSFMSGNSTRLAVGVATGSGRTGLIAGGLIAAFLTGVVVGALVGAWAKDARRPLVLALLAGLLTLAAGSAGAAPLWVTAGMVAAAMGAANTVFERDGDVAIGVTYMTGALVKVGHRIAAALRGGDRLGWWPYLQLWLGLVTGGAAGAVAHGRLGLGGLWVAAALAAVCGVAAVVIDRRVDGAGG